MRAARLFLPIVLSSVIISHVAMPAALAHAETKFGVHMDLTFDGWSWRRTLAIEQARDVLHAQISRNGLLWHVVEPRRGKRNWRRTDSVVRDLRKAGIEPLMTIWGSPAWASGADPRGHKFYTHVPRGRTAFKRWLGRYSAFVYAAVKRYRDRVHRWELWNEPNLWQSWRPQPSIARYARFYRAIRTAILRADPHAEVAVGGLANITVGPRRSISGMKFLRGLHARGINFDHVAIHPYPGQYQAPEVHLPWEDNFDDIARVHDWLARIGDYSPLWVTEFGWPTSLVSPETQANNITDALELIRSRYPYVELATIFTNYDRLPEYTQGLFDASFKPKPAALRFGAFMAGLADGG